MPRDGSGNFTKLPPDDVISGTTIESAGYNLFTNDVEFDLNWPRPISTGGTGATSASAARIALGAEAAKQGPVTNFSSFPFTNGSFYADASATGAPTANRFAGSYYGNSDDSYATLQARDLTTGLMYMKRKVAGVWDGSWFQDAGTQADTDARYVNVTGDTMSGTLSINGALTVSTEIFTGYGATTGVVRFANNPANFLYFNGTDYQLSAATGGGLNCAGLTTGAIAAAGNITGARFIASAGSYTSGGEVQVSNLDGFRHISGNYGVITRSDGSSYYLLVTNSGNPLGTFNGLRPFQFNLSNGDVIMGHNVNVGGNISVSGSITSGSVFAASTSNVILAPTGAGAVYFRPNGAGSAAGETYINSAGSLVSNYSIHSPGSGGGIFAYNVTNPGGATTLNAMTGQPSGTASNMSIYYMHVAGVWIGYQFTISGSSDFQFRHDSSAFKTGGSTSWQIISDERIKTVTGEYTTGLDAIMALRPVRYTLKGNVSLTAPEVDAKPAEPDEYGYKGKALATEHIGLVAQEAEGPMPELVNIGTGYIDGKEVSDLRSFDAAPLVFALINAVKELKAKVEALEAR